MAVDADDNDVDDDDDEHDTVDDGDDVGIPVFNPDNCPAKLATSSKSLISMLAAAAAAAFMLLLMEAVAVAALVLVINTPLAVLLVDGTAARTGFIVSLLCSNRLRNRSRVSL